MAELRDGGLISGRVGDEAVVVVARHTKFFAIGATCTHYKGPLADGLVVGDTIRCPWHHACFSLQTGEALEAPALDPVPCWRVDCDGDRIFVREKQTPRPSRSDGQRDRWPESVVIVGGGAAGLATAEALRRQGYDRSVTMLSAEASPPTDRPNLSKDYLAGQAQEDWIPLRGPTFYQDHHIDLALGASVQSIDPAQRVVRVSDGRSYPFGALLIATGAEPVRLDVPGATLPHVHYLRTLADSNAIIAHAATAKRAVVVGASFIGLEVAASLRARHVDVHMVAPDRHPMQRVLGAEIGEWVQRRHESHGVVFHLGRHVDRIEPGRVSFSDATTLDADMVVVGIGVRPRIELADAAHLAIDRGIVVDQYLETSAPGVFAAGDVARSPDPHTGQTIRVEHWVVAERQGQTAARNMLGARERFDSVPFFWSQHYDTAINYVGHAESWDSVEIDGALEANDCALTYLQRGRRVAMATIGRDRQSLEFEAALEGSFAPST